MLDRLKIILPPSEDLIHKTLKHPVTQQYIEMAMYLPLIDEAKVNSFITVPFTKNEYPFAILLQTNSNFDVVEDPTTWVDLLLRGQVLVMHQNIIYAFDAMKYSYNEANDTKAESTIRGPQHALSEDPLTSLNLIRNAYMSPDLHIEKKEIGTLSQTSLYVMYDQRKVNPETLNELNTKIESIHLDVINSTGELERLISGKKYSLFPTVLISERVDRVARALTFGKIVLMLKGSQFAIILPVTFFDFMHAVEDHYESFWMTRLLIIVRYIALFITTTLPGLYIAILSYNPEVFRIQLAFSLVASRSVVPYPSFIEVFIMLLMIEMLLEASIRIPRLIGSASTTVGGLILGSSIQQAGLVSSIMIIVTSLVAISNFVLPIHTMSLAVRFLKYPIILVAIFFGLTGVCVVLFAYLVYLTHMRSFGEYYFRIRGKLSPPEGDIGQAGL